MFEKIKALFDKIFEKFKGNLNKEQKNNNANKSFQWGILLAVIGVGLVAFFVAGNKNQAARNDKLNAAGNFTIIQQEKLLEDSWVKQSAQELRELRQQIQQVQGELEKERRAREALEKQQNTSAVSQNNTAPKQESSDPEDVPYRQIFGGGKYPVVRKNDPNLKQNAPAQNQTQNQTSANSNLTRAQEFDLFAAGQNPQQTQAAPAEPVLVSTTQAYTNTMAFNQVIATDEVANNTTLSAEKLKKYITAGAILTGVITNGMDAPTQSEASGTPLIMHITLTDLGILPNEREFDLKGCFLLGEGTGDLSSERVYVRTNTLSCITADDEYINLGLKGYVTGEDGKMGLAGRVVSKQGAILARTLMSGFLEGVGEGFSEVGDSISYLNSAGGVATSTSSVSGGQLAQKGLAEGLAKSASKLSEFYLKLAEQMFPVIEISAGRQINVIVTNLTPIDTIDGAQQAKAAVGSSMN